jgi:hypothetical protein
MLQASFDGPFQILEVVGILILVLLEVVVVSVVSRGRSNKIVYMRRDDRPIWIWRSLARPKLRAFRLRLDCTD